VVYCVYQSLAVMAKGDIARDAPSAETEESR